MKRRPRRKRKALDIILAVICASSLAAAALIGWTIPHEGAVYSEISAEAGSAEGGGIDWEALRARNPDISAWVSVEGTPIDYPVVSPREGDPQGFYLNHDFDRNWSFAGCPYLDPRGTADGRHALVYGHHLNFDSEMFTYLRNAWRQEKFDTLGDMYWSTPDGGTMRLHPAFSLSVDKSFAGIQRFDLTGRDTDMACGPLGAGGREGGGVRRPVRARHARRHARDVHRKLRRRQGEDPHGIRRLNFSGKHVTPWKRGAKEGIKTGIKKVRKR